MVFLRACLKTSISNDKVVRDLKKVVYKGRKTSDELDSIDNILLNNLSILFLCAVGKPWQTLVGIVYAQIGIFIPYRSYNFLLNGVIMSYLISFSWDFVV